jgi:hypothetical protein
MSIPAGHQQPYLSATLKYELRDSTDLVEHNLEATATDGGVEVEAQRLRLALVDCVHVGMALAQGGNSGEALDLVKRLTGDALSSPAAKDARVAALAEDLTGQITEALSRAEYYKRWGRHYLPSLARAHLLQQCTNFKDPGVQHYGGRLFRQLRDEIDDIFVKLPPPKPSVVPTTNAPSAPVRSMSTYHNSSNPCFHGACTALLADGATSKPLSQLVKGDRVATTTSGGSARVVCVVRTRCAGGRAQLVELERSGLLVTPYHPVRDEEGRWRFPCELAPALERSCEAVYSFVLDEGHTMVINGVECVSLGHGFGEDPVVSHPYFGSARVVEDLQKMRGWEAGLVQFESGCLERHLESGLVCGFTAALELAA